MLLNIKSFVKDLKINVLLRSIYLMLFPCQLHVNCKLTFHPNNSHHANVELFGCHGDHNRRNTVAYLLIYEATDHLLKHCHGNA
jgi:hypothetical protein